MTELVRSATVVMSFGTDPAGLRHKGSGFFVAPGRVVTCAHCVHGHEHELWIEWRGAPPRPATVLAIDPTAPAVDSESTRFPDAAIVAVEGLGPHPCVPLATAEPSPGDRVYVYGISDVRTGIPEPDGSVTRFDSVVAAPPARFYKLGLGEVGKGMSGGPVVDLEMQAVIGVMKASRALDTDLGGHAVPIADALAIHAAEDLGAANMACNSDTLDALRARQSSLEDLPQLVGEMLRPVSGTIELILARDEYGVRRPAGGVPDALLHEWVARQLFTLSIGELVAVLYEVSNPLGRAVVDVCQLVAGCLPIHPDEPVSWWLSTDAAVAARVELRKERPRVIRLSTEQSVTLSLLLRRALARKAPLLPRGGTPYGAQADAGLPRDLVEEIKQALGQRFYFDPSEWEKHKEKIIRELRKQFAVANLNPDVLTDVRLLASLLDTFGGMRFVVCSRQDPPAGAEDVLLDLRPPIEEENERLALGNLKTIEEEFQEPVASTAAARP